MRAIEKGTLLARLEGVVRGFAEEMRLVTRPVARGALCNARATVRSRYHLVILVRGLQLSRFSLFLFFFFHEFFN